MQQALFSTPADTPDKAEQEFARLEGLGQSELKKQVYQHITQVYAYDGRIAATLKVSGFSDNSADYGTQ